MLLNRYKGANDYVGWHSDDEKLYGPTPEIASLSFGCERDFVLKKKKLQEDSSHGMETFLIHARLSEGLTFVWCV